MSALHINRGPGPVKEIKRESIGLRWCFACRKRLEYECVIYAYDCDPLDDPYGPWAAFLCTRCNDERDLFPGHERYSA